MNITNGVYIEKVDVPEWIDDLNEIVEHDTDKLIRILQILNCQMMCTVNIQKKIRDANIRAEYSMYLQGEPFVRITIIKEMLSKKYKLSVRQIERIVI